jgi:hypothetical protein
VVFLDEDLHAIPEGRRLNILILGKNHHRRQENDSSPSHGIKISDLRRRLIVGPGVQRITAWRSLSMRQRSGATPVPKLHY